MRLRSQFVIFYCLLFLSQLSRASGDSWVATWAASPEWADSNAKSPLLNINDQTVRERVRLSIGGSRICIRLSNEYGGNPLSIGATTVGIPNDSASVRADTIRTVTFAGRDAVTLPAGAAVISDPISLPVTSGSEISVSLYFPNPVMTPTLHELALKRAIISRPGNHTLDEKIEAIATQTSSISLSAVLVPVQPSQQLVVTFGDSITDGDGSSVDADRNWPGDLIRRLQETPGGRTVAVANAGVAGNRLLTDGFPAGAGFGAGFGLSALRRFNRDVLALPGVTHVVLLEGVNDIGFPGAKIGERYLADPAHPCTPEELFSAYRRLISRAHARGVKIIGATIGPFEGADVPGYFSQSKEKTRQAVNKWIRTSGAFDGVIDFDAVLRDPNHPSRLLPLYASKDQLHPNDVGYQAMADAIDLTLFK
jgi:lysophospholipase L1-like esterase